MKHYYDEITLLKGVVIFLAVVGHSLPDASKGFYIAGSDSFSEFMYRWIYSFHMAAFFFCAGFLWLPKIAKTDTYFMRGAVLKRVRRLMVPYFFYSFIYLFMKTILASLADHPLEENAFLLMFFGVSPCFGCWFLWVLFMISILFVPFRKFSITWLLLIAFVLYLIGVIANKEYFVGHVGNVLRDSLWFALGGFISTRYDHLKLLLKKPIIGLVCFIGLTLMCFCDFGNEYSILKGMLKTLCGIEMGLSLSCFIYERCHDSFVYKIAKLLGNYSMDIYLLSMFVLVPMRILYVNLGLMNFTNYYVYVIVSVLLGIISPYLVSKYIVRNQKILRAFLIGG